MTDVSVTLRLPCLCPSEGHKHGVSIQSSINLGDALLQITCECLKTAGTWFLARLFIYQSSIVSQILDIFHWIVAIFSFDHMTDENQEFAIWSFKHVHTCSINLADASVLMDMTGEVHFFIIKKNKIQIFNTFHCRRSLSLSGISTDLRNHYQEVGR